MFGNKQKKENNGKSIMPTSMSHSLNSLVKGTSVEGTIHSESDIRIDGVLKGNLTCKSKIIIGPSGEVYGEMKCENAVIEGRFEGTLLVAGLLHIKESAEINGDISTNKLIVQSGAVFNVACNMGTAANNGTHKSINEARKIVSKGKASQQNIGEKNKLQKEAS